MIVKKMFKRFAIYAVPAAEDPLFLLASRWLGWDSAHAQHFEPPMGLDKPSWDKLTARPRKYGFHGTLRPPMVTAHGVGREDIICVMQDVALHHHAFEAALELTNMDGFFALTLATHQNEMHALAQELVLATDGLRATPSEQELERRRAVGLTKRQDELLRAHGYPYVLDEFRYHMTLSGVVDPMQQAEVADIVRNHLPKNRLSLKMDRLTLLGEDGAGMFHVITTARLSF